MLISDDETREEMNAGCDCSQQASQLVAEQMPVSG